MTFFAINHPEPNYGSALTAAWTAAASEADGLKLFALVDGAFDARWQGWVAARLPGTYTVSLYDGTALSGFGSLAPHLIELPSIQAAQSGYLTPIVRRCAGKPMLTFIASTESVQDLKAHFEQVIKVTTEDEQQFVLRFADVRILAPLIAALTESQRREFLAPIRHWWAQDRQGRLLSLIDHIATSVQPNPNAKTSFDPLLLSDSQFSTLLSAAEADLIVEQLHRIVPEQCLKFSPGDLYEFVTEQLQHMARFGIEGMADRIAYCIGAFNTRGRLHDLEEARALFVTPNWQPGNLAEALANLPDTCWAM
jgi:hypothetical protein